MRKLMILLLILTLAFPCVSCGNKSSTEQPKADQSVSDTASAADTASQPVPAVSERTSYEGSGFDTPEDAVLFFLDGLKKLDLEQMLDAYTWETRASRFAAREYLLWNKTFDENMIWLPTYSDGITGLNLEAMRESETESIRRSIAVWLFSDFHSNDPIALRTEEDIQAFHEKLDGKKLELLKDMKNIRFLTVNDIMGAEFWTDRKKEKLQRDQENYDMDELVHLPTIADVGDEKLLLIPYVARYGDRWYLFTLDSFVMGQVITKKGRTRTGFRFYTDLPFSDLLARSAEESDPTTQMLPKIQYEGDGFSTPEEAVMAYFDGLKNADVKQMLRAFAWETLAEKCDIDAYLAYTGSFFPTLDPFPNANPFVAQTNMHYLRGQQINYIYQSFVQYLLPENYLSDRGIGTKSPSLGRLKEEELEALIQYFLDHEQEKIDALRRIDHVRFITPDQATDGAFSDVKPEYYAGQTALYGADEVRDLVAVADIGEEHILVAPAVARYGDRWYLVNLKSVTRELMGKYYLDRYLYGFAYGPNITLPGQP